jgi:CYTH domain-containing protein
VTVRSPSLKYAVVERERRFVLREVPGGCGPATTIEDRYVPGSRLRLREMVAPDGTRTRKLGHKVRLDDAARAVACTNMYLDDMEWSLLVELPAVRLRKRRVVLPLESVAGDTAAIDAFEGDALGGLVLAEVDLRERPDVELRLPFATVAEVTGDDRFTGGRLADTSRADLRAAVGEYGVSLGD